METIKGHVIIQDMLDQGIHMLPATIDPFLKEGPAISWLRHGNKQQIFHQEYITLEMQQALKHD